MIFGLVFVSRDFEVGTSVSCEQSTVSLRTGLIFHLLGRLQHHLIRFCENIEPSVSHVL